METKRVKHLKRGTTYVVLGIAEMQSTLPVAEGVKLVCYQSEQDNKLWARPMDEFCDGRFLDLTDKTLEETKDE